MSKNRAKLARSHLVRDPEALAGDGEASEALQRQQRGLGGEESSVSHSFLSTLPLAVPNASGSYMT